MKIMCDACENARATVYCIQDEANLCPSCDSRIHCANKLASSHKRVAIDSMSDNEMKCDVCQEARAVFFCRIDRCILCPACDAATHKKGTLGGTHERHLLTGLSACKPADNPEPLPPIVQRPPPIPVDNKPPREVPQQSRDAQVPVLGGNNGQGSDRGMGVPVQSWTNLEELLGFPTEDAFNPKKWNGEPGFDDLDFVDDDFDMLVPVWEETGNSKHAKDPQGMNAVPVASALGPPQAVPQAANNQYKNHSTQPSNNNAAQEMPDMWVNSEQNFEDDFLVPDMGDKKRRRVG